MQKDRKKEFMKVFETLYTIHRGSYDRGQKDLFMAMADVYYKLSDSIPTDYFSQFITRFKDGWPSPKTWESAVSEYWSETRKKEPEQKEEPMRPRDRAFTQSLCRAQMFRNPSDNKEFGSAIRMLATIKVFETFKYPLPDYWKRQLAQTRPEIKDAAQKYLEKCKYEVWRHEKARDGFEKRTEAVSLIVNPGPSVPEGE